MKRAAGGEKTFDTINIIIMIIILFAVLIPLIYVVLNSLVSVEEAGRRTNIILPEKIDFGAYRLVLFSSRDIINGYKMTLFRVITGTFLNMLFSSFLAYSLSRKDLPGRYIITIFLFITMIFGGGLIPYYIIVKVTGLYNNIWVYIIPGLISVWYVFLLRNFMMEIPESISESAEIDGASQIAIIFRLIIPLSIPSLVTIALFYAVGHWNAWFDGYIFITEKSKYTVQLTLRNILVTSQLSYENLTGAAMEDIFTHGKPPPSSIKNASIVITTAPIVCVYPYIQKYFIKGIMVGSVKG